MKHSDELTPNGSDQGSTRLKRVVAAAMAGTIVEWYEFFIYGTAATLVFSKIFFPPGTSELTAILAAFVTYAVGFVARPVGGVVFGYFGDRYGRKHLLQISLAIVGTSTFLMGCLPEYASIGIWAPLMLVVLRFLQGFALGGEWGGAVLLVAEHSPDNRRGFWTSWPQAGVPGGNLLATIVLLVLTSVLSDADFLAWGWRIAFWLSAVIVFVGFYIRTKVSDAPVFEAALREVAHTEAAQHHGVFEVVKRYPRQILTAMGIRFGENVLYYLVATFSVTYLAVVADIGTERILWYMLISHSVHFVLVPLAGRLSDRVGRRPVYFAGAVLGAVWGFAAYPLMASGNAVLIVLAISGGLGIHALMYAPQPSMMAEMFPTRMRYLGLSLGSQVTSIFAGSLAPIIAVSLLKKFDSAVPIAIYLAVTCVVTAGAVLYAKETKGESLQALDQQDLAADTASV